MAYAWITPNVFFCAHSLVANMVDVYVNECSTFGPAKYNKTTIIFITIVIVRHCILSYLASIPR
jgi:hypothetical protein